MKPYNERLSYEIVEDGYIIYLDNAPYVEQHDPYAKQFLPDEDYEANCLIHIEEIASFLESESSVSIIYKNRANIDYIAMMTDVELPE